MTQQESQTVMTDLWESKTDSSFLATAVLATASQNTVTSLHALRLESNHRYQSNKWSMTRWSQFAKA